jgi:hypothetical protein
VALATGEMFLLIRPTMPLAPRVTEPHSSQAPATTADQKDEVTI